jgi:threonine/homoserine/homoserine lactone efflux protein
MIWRHATVPVAMAAEAHGRSNLMKSFGLALATQFSNPKIVAVFGAVFAALLPANPPLWLDLALPPLIFCQETLWYGLVALAFSAAAPRALYLRARTVIDRTASTIIGLLGVRLILDAR